MSEIRIELDGPPRGKGRPRFRRGKTKTGREFVTTYTDGKTVSYEYALGWAAKTAMGTRAPLTAPLIVAVYVGMPIPQSWSKSKRRDAASGSIFPIVKPDFDNLLKTLDSCNKIVWVDDCQIVDASISKRYAEKPYLLVVVRPLESPSCLPARVVETPSK